MDVVSVSFHGTGWVLLSCAVYVVAICFMLAVAAGAKWLHSLGDIAPQSDKSIYDDSAEEAVVRSHWPPYWMFFGLACGAVVGSLVKFSALPLPLIALVAGIFIGWVVAALIEAFSAIKQPRTPVLVTALAFGAVIGWAVGSLTSPLGMIGAGVNVLIVIVLIGWALGSRRPEAPGHIA